MPIDRFLPSRRPGSILAIDLSRPVTDDPTMPPLARMMRQGAHELRDVVELLDEAASDPRIEAVMARVDAPAGNWAHAHELYAAVRAFRASGKPAIAHAQTFGEAGNASLGYLVASAFDEIHLQPTGQLGVVGVTMAAPFMAELLERLGITPQFRHRHEYKTAGNMFTEREFTDAHHESLDRVVESLHDHLVTAVADGRGLTRDTVRDLFDATPLLANDALEHGLVDRLSFRDQTVVAVKSRVSSDATILAAPRYRQMVQRRGWRPNRPRIALVHGHGGIQVGRSRRALGGAVMGSDTVALGLTQAIHDDRVRGIVFRVDSGGGSVVASDAIARALRRAKEAGKPVVVTMGAVAASGGYWVSMDADRIIAAPGTITGSIGVVHGKLVTRRLLERAGIGVGEVHRGQNALMDSPLTEVTDDQAANIDRFLDTVYDEFVTDVARARNLERSHVHDVAKGRIWTGEDAAQHGLVDELGGYFDAFAAVRSLAGLGRDEPVQVSALPHLSFAERLGLTQPMDDDVAALVRGVATVARGVRTRTGVQARLPEWFEPDR